jgi:hypothetical protein
MKTKDMVICLMWTHLHTPRNDKFMNLLFFLRVMPFIFNLFSLKYATRCQDPIYLIIIALIHRSCMLIMCIILFYFSNLEITMS